MDDGYNYIYSRLVESPDDMLGIIAYSFYKKQKIEFISTFKQKHSRLPSDSELEVFYLASNGEASISSYRTKAENLSRNFVDAVLGEQLKIIKEQSDLELVSRVRGLRPAFWQSVAQNVFASVLFVLLIGVLVFFTWSFRFGFSEALQQMMGVEFVNKSDSPNPSSGKSR